MTQRLKQLDEEVPNATVKAEGAQEAWSTATDSQRKADLKEILQQLQDDNEQLLAERRALAAQLTSLGLQTPPLAHDCSVSDAKRMV